MVLPTTCRLHSYAASGKVWKERESDEDGCLRVPLVFLVLLVLLFLLFSLSYELSADIEVEIGSRVASPVMGSTSRGDEGTEALTGGPELLSDITVSGNAEQNKAYFVLFYFIKYNICDVLLKRKRKSHL